MRRSYLAATLLAAAPFAMAQATDAPKAAHAPDVPKPSCGAAPELPGRVILQDESVRKRFEGEVTRYKDCMKAYVEERQAAAKAHAAAGNEAVNDFNAWANALAEEQKKRRGGSDADPGASGGAPSAGSPRSY